MNAQKTIQIVTPPASEPLTLAEVKEFLRVDHSDDDATLAIFITAARQLCESYTRMALLPTTFEEYFDDFPQYTGTFKDEIRLSRSPVSAVTYVKYIDGNETTITADAAEYKVDTISRPARISPDNGWFGTYETINVVFVRYVAGFANAGVRTSAVETRNDARHWRYVRKPHGFREAFANGVGISLESIPRFRVLK
jgi:uncharacterized phiE125 gp8 family phage protein